MGLRNRHEKAWRISIGFGSRVFVCDNMAFVAEQIVRRKHTANGKRDLPSLVAQLVEPLTEQREAKAQAFERLKRTALTDQTADHALNLASKRGSPYRRPAAQVACKKILITCGSSAMALRRLWFPICLLTRVAGVMLLTRVVRVDDPDIGRYAWSRLRRFLNISEVEERIFHLHRLEARQRANARKQATQIRRCLIQAQEYFEAASAVSLATKPVLFYYCIMSLALAEVLLKQSGMSSLDRAREQNKHHGLSFSVSGRPRDGQMLEQTAGWLVAVPLVRPSGEPFGTFALWHHSSRETPLVGPRRRYPATGGASTGPEIILSGANVPLRPLPSGGISLVECLRNLPGMMGAVAQFGVEPNIVRARVQLSTREDDDKLRYEIVIHPGIKGVIDRFLDNVFFHPADALERLDFRELGSGGIIEWVDTRGEPMRLHFPMGITWTTQEVRFWHCNQPLNEFGFMYVALYIAGNYARYYPDLWMRDVEQSSPLALVIEELLAMARHGECLC